MSRERQPKLPESRAGWFWPLIYTVSLHAILFALLFVSFAFAPQIPSARPVIQATVYQLEAQRPKSAANPAKITAEAEKTKAKEREAEQLEQQKRQAEAEQLRQQRAEQLRLAEQQKQAEAARQAEAQKQADLLKQAEEQARQVAEAAKAQAAEAKRLEAEQKQREADAAKKREAEAARQKAEREAAEKAAKAAEEKRKQQAAEEKRKREAEALAKKQREATELAEKKKREAFEAEQARRKAEEDKKAKARADLIAAEVERRRAQGESEQKRLIASLDDLIIRLVSEQWIRPVSARDGMSNEVQLSMLPDGTISQVALIRSSGDTAFDSSTLAALRSIGRIPEIQQLDRASFDALYRTRRMIFRPEELGGAF